MIPEKIVARVVHDGNGCWRWSGAHTGEGYGRVRIEGRPQYVHRVVYAAVKGPIPPGLQLDHVCRVRDCCNPDHLEAVTGLENMRRGKWATVTECIHGHDYTPENTARTSAGSRRCRKCDRARKVAYRKSQREQKVTA